jgi:hypothetical protein
MIRRRTARRRRKKKEEGIFSQITRTQQGFHPTTYQTSTRGCFPTGKAVMA